MPVMPPLGSTSKSDHDENGARWAWYYSARVEIAVSIPFPSTKGVRGDLMKKL